MKTLEEDLKDGQLLIELVNRLAATEDAQSTQGGKAEGPRGPKSIEKWDKNPRGKLQCLENIGMALHFCELHNIKLVNIGELAERERERERVEKKARKGVTGWEVLTTNSCEIHCMTRRCVNQIRAPPIFYNFLFLHTP